MVKLRKSGFIVWFSAIIGIAFSGCVSAGTLPEPFKSDTAGSTSGTGWRDRFGIWRFAGALTRQAYYFHGYCCKIVWKSGMM